MNKIKAYISHPIRGKLGNKATDIDMAMNCSKAICVGTVLELCVPDLELYIPARYDIPITIAYRRKMLTVDQILDIDCQIISQQDLLIVYNWDNYLSGGMVTEINYAKKHGIPLYSFMELNERVLDELRDIVKELQNE